MKIQYLNIYNNLIKLTRNKLLMSKITNVDSFSDRLIVFLFHFAFFLREYKNDNNREELQKVYDFIFKQIDISIREIGYGDMSINKKMKNYINLFHSILLKIENWHNLNDEEKSSILQNSINENIDSQYFIKYFDDFRSFLINNTFNSFTKDIIEFKN